jgi:hypothetical protein
MTSRASERSPNELASRRNPGRAVQGSAGPWCLLAAENLERASLHQNASQRQLIGSRQGAALNW